MNTQHPELSGCWRQLGISWPRTLAVKSKALYLGYCIFVVKNYTGFKAEPHLTSFHLYYQKLALL